MKRYVIKRPAGSQLPDRLARYREELNAEQFAVATAPAGAALVIAGAGSGKTRAITYRVAYLVEHGVAPARVCLATFTNRAAREMLRRAEQWTGGGGDAERKRERNVMDYDDLLLNWKRLREEKEEIARIYQEQFEHILVDEYQDTNKLQAEIVDLLAVKHRNVMVVGDDAQSIFAFRGASVEVIYEFPKRYPEARVFRLETNYRSTPEILAVANVSIASNRRQLPKTLRAARPPLGITPALVPCRDADQQAVLLASRILELRDEGIALNEMAVLYRSHYHSLELQLELTRRAVPYRVRSGVCFFEQAHIKDVVSYLRLVANPRDELAWKRVLRLIPNVGTATANRVWERIASAPDPLALVLRGDADSAAAKRGTGWREFRALLEELVRDEVRTSPARQIETVLARGYEDYLESNYENAEARLEDLRQLAHYSARYTSAEEFLAELALLSTERYGAPQPLTAEDVIEGGDEDELLTLSSVHQADRKSVV